MYIYLSKGNGYVDNTEQCYGQAKHLSMLDTIMALKLDFVYVPKFP